MTDTGTSTSGPTLANIFFFLLHYPDAYAKAVTEIRSTFANEEEIVLGTRLSSCEYLSACIDETIRLCPVIANFLPRTVEAGGVSVGGHVFAEGTCVGASIYAVHQNEELFPEPHLFKPERFLTDDGKKVWHKGYVPYSTGPRACPGWRLASVEASLAVARTLWRYDVRLASGKGVQALNGLEWPERKFKSWIGLKVDGPVAQFKRREQ